MVVLRPRQGFKPLATVKRSSPRGRHPGTAPFRGRLFRGSQGFQSLAEAAARLLLLLLVLGTPAWADAQDDLEYQVKAAFLFNFAKFAEWPADAFEGPDDPITICVAGDDPFGESLDAVVRGETVSGRRLTVRRTQSLSKLKDCQIVFVPRSERARRRAILSSLEGTAVLSVGEDDGFLTDGGVVRFVLDQNRIRFEINLAAAEGNRLKLSSKLLRLARAVYPSQPGQGG